MIEMTHTQKLLHQAFGTEIYKAKTIEATARKAGITSATVYNWVAGRSDAQLNKFGRYIEANGKKIGVSDEI